MGKLKQHVQRARGGIPTGNPTGRHEFISSPEPSLTSLVPSHELGTREGAYDHWNWPYPSAINRYTFFNAWQGNQLPGFHKNTRLHPGEGWVLITSQQSMERQRAGAMPTTGMSHQDIVSLMRNVQAIWSNTDSENR